MATINLGRVKLVNRGTWSSANTYAIDDFVQFTDNGVVSTYIAVAASTNQTPSTSGTENSNFWKFLAKGVSLAVGNNKVVTSDASGNLQGLSIGAAGTVLKVNASANGYEFGTGAKYIKTQQFTNNTRTSIGASTSRSTFWNAGVFAKTTANSTLRIRTQIPGGGNPTTYPHFASEFIRLSTTNYNNDGSDLFGYIINTRATSNNMGAVLISDFLYDTTGTNIAAAGDVYITYGFHTANPSSTLRPFPIMNPNVSDQDRSRQSASWCLVDEIV